MGTALARSDVQLQRRENFPSEHTRVPPPPPLPPLLRSPGAHAARQIRFKFRFGDAPASSAGDGGPARPDDAAGGDGGDGGAHYFAFSYPYSFEEVMAKVDRLQAAFAPRPAADPARPSPPERVYFHREVLTRSLEGR